MAASFGVNRTGWASRLNRKTISQNFNKRALNERALSTGASYSGNRIHEFQPEAFRADSMRKSMLRPADGNRTANWFEAGFAKRNWNGQEDDQATSMDCNGNI